MSKYGMGSAGFPCPVCGQTAQGVFTIREVSTAGDRMVTKYDHGTTACCLVSETILDSEALKTNPWYTKDA